MYVASITHWCGCRFRCISAPSAMGQCAEVQVGRGRTRRGRPMGAPRTLPAQAAATATEGCSRWDDEIWPARAIAFNMHTRCDRSWVCGRGVCEAHVKSADRKAIARRSRPPKRTPQERRVWQPAARTRDRDKRQDLGAISCGAPLDTAGNIPACGRKSFDDGVPGCAKCPACCAWMTQRPLAGR